MDYEFEIYEAKLFSEIDKILKEKESKEKVNINKIKKGKSINNFNKNQKIAYKNNINKKFKKRKIDKFELLFKNYIELKPKITIEKEIELLERYKKFGDEKARKELIEYNLRFVYYYVNKYYSEYEDEFMDIIQDASIGLIKAIDKFDYQYKNRLITYASWWIRQNIERNLKFANYLILPPKHLWSKIIKINKDLIYHNKYHENNSRFKEFYNTVGYNNGQIEKIQYYLGFKYFSLYTNINELSINDLNNIKNKIHYEDEDNYSNYQLQDLIIDENVVNNDNNIDMDTIKNIVFNYLQELKENIRNVIIMRFGLDGNLPMTLQEIAEKFDLTRERIRQIELHGLEILKNKLIKNKIFKNYDNFFNL